MPIHLTTLLKKAPCWYSSGADGRDVVIATMARMVRNLPDHPFPGWSTAEDRAAVAAKVLPALRSFPAFRSCMHAEMTDLGQEERLVLLERKQISPSMAGRQDGCHLLISRDQKCFAMVNEEEHLCVHTSVQGLDVDTLLDKVDRLGKHLESKLEFATKPGTGYLTSLPAEAGEGLQLYTILHLPALAMADTMDKVRHAIESLNLSLTSFYPEAEDAGNLFVLFTPAIPKGMRQQEVEHFCHICETLADKELRMRDKLLEEEETNPIDPIYRAFGLLSYAMCMDFKELLQAISLVRLGLHYNILSSDTPSGDIPGDLFRLYALSPALLRHSAGHCFASACEARAVRSLAVRTAMDSIKPILTTPF